MFTGIVEEIGTVAVLEAYRMRVRAERVMEDLKLGDSIAVNGACLTAVAPGRRGIRRRSFPGNTAAPSIGELSPGKAVNLERPLGVTDRLGGHIVQGHVDAAGRISSSKPEGDCHVVRVRSPKRMMPYIVEKGFIAVDGISLTVVKRILPLSHYLSYPSQWRTRTLKRRGPETASTWNSTSSPSTSRVSWGNSRNCRKERTPREGQ